jgi:hypothetical protein
MFKNKLLQIALNIINPRFIPIKQEDYKDYINFGNIEKERNGLRFRSNRSNVIYVYRNEVILGFISTPGSNIKYIKFYFEKEILEALSGREIRNILKKIKNTFVEIFDEIVEETNKEEEKNICSIREELKLEELMK